MKLHRIHAEVSGSGFSFDLGSMRWRADGGTLAERKAAATRLVFAYNMAEGVPTKALEAGCVGNFYCATRALIEWLEQHTPGYDVDHLKKLIDETRAAYSAHAFDNTNGRPHDCARCLEDADGKAD